MPEANEAAFFAFEVPVPAVFLDLTKARKFKDAKTNQEGPPRFGATFLIPHAHPQLAVLNGLVVGAARAFFGARDLSTLHLPLENGDTKNDAKPWMKGHVLFRTQSGEEYPPTLRSVHGGQMTEIEDRALAASSFWPGVLCGGSVKIVAYAGMGGGVTAYLNDIVSLRRGDRIADRGDGSKRHESLLKYVGTVSSVDPTVGMPGMAPGEMAY